MLITTTFSFELGSVTGEFLNELVIASRFRPTRIRTSDFKRRGGTFEPNDLRRLRNGTPPQVTLEGATGVGGPYLRFGRFPAWGFEAFTWNVSASDQPDWRVLNQVAAHSGFTSGTSAAADYTYWQSETSLDAYRAARLSVDQLPTVRDSSLNEEIVDISRHPGRRTLFARMWLHAAWRMWFGHAAFEFLSKHRLASFRGARRIEELEPGVTFIELFEMPESAPWHEDIASAFRKWTGMDDLEAQASAVAAGVSDPTFEVVEGASDSGVARRVVEWLDERGDLIRRSRAQVRRTIDLDASGKVIRATDEPAHNGC